MKHRRIFQTFQKARFVDLLPSSRCRLWVDLCQSRKFSKLRRATVFRTKTDYRVARCLSAIARQKVSEAWANDDGEVLDKVLRSACLFQGAEGKAMEGPVGNDSKGAVR